MEVSVEKPGSPTDILEHFGTKGMKWGVRSESRSSGSKPSFRKQFPTSSARTAEIHRARASTQADYIKMLGEKNPAKREKLVKTYLKNPDRATAERVTRGEKAVIGILAGAFAVPTAGAAPAAAIGYTGTGLAIRKTIERRQRRGAYG
jgi:hypothetical protein